MPQNQISEQKARDNIARMLENSGWIVQDNSKDQTQLDEVFFSQIL